MQTLPKVGESATVPGISFPLVVETYNELTRMASLKGEHPETGMEVLVPKVCFSEVHASATPPKPLMEIGQGAFLKSGGPLMTIVSIDMPPPFSPEFMQPMVTCMCFRESGELLTMTVDVRALKLVTPQPA
jgi:hypothetical protein